MSGSEYIHCQKCYDKLIYTEHESRPVVYCGKCVQQLQAELNHFKEEMLFSMETKDTFKASWGEEKKRRKQLQAELDKANDLLEAYATVRSPANPLWLKNKELQARNDKQADEITRLSKMGEENATPSKD